MTPSSWQSRLGLARRGLAGRGEAVMARCGLGRQGLAGSGLAWRPRLGAGGAAGVGVARCLLGTWRCPRESNGGSLSSKHQ